MEFSIDKASVFTGGSNRPVKMLHDLQLIATEMKPPAIIQESGYK